LNRFISIGLLIVLNVPMFIKGGIILQWNIQREYIAQNLCVKRNMAENDCNGQCHLKKQLDQVENNNPSDKASVPLKLKLSESEGLPILLSCFPDNFFVETKNKFALINPSLYQYLMVKNNDRPPQNLV